MSTAHAKGLEWDSAWGIREAEEGAQDSGRTRMFNGVKVRHGKDGSRRQGQRPDYEKGL